MWKPRACTACSQVRLRTLGPARGVWAGAVLKRRLAMMITCVLAHCESCRRLNPHTHPLTVSLLLPRRGDLERDSGPTMYCRQWHGIGLEGVPDRVGWGWLLVQSSVQVCIRPGRRILLPRPVGHTRLPSFQHCDAARARKHGGGVTAPVREDTRIGVGPDVLKDEAEAETH